MNKMNLSFKEWPFVSFHKSQQQEENQCSLPSKIPSLTETEIQMLRSNIPINLIQRKDIISLHQNSNNNNDIHSIYKIPLSKKNNNYHLTSYGRCGLFAVTNESCLSIYSSNNNGCLTPIYMFSPFEKYTIGKINKLAPKSSFITAVAWSNGFLEPCLPKPILAVSSERGHVLIYDVCSKKIIGNIRFNETIVSIVWSSYKHNIFYAGSSLGHFFICEMKAKSVEIIKHLEFSAKSLNDENETIPKSVDFICQDDINGLNVAVASKDGTIGFITDINEPEQAKIHVFHDIDYNYANNDSNIRINFFEFYPNNSDFIMIATNISTHLISLSKGILIPFISSRNCRFISLLDKEHDKVIVGDDNDIAVWKLVEQKWIRLSVLKVGCTFGFTEILTFSKHGDQILLTTASNWLTKVEYRNNKVFITERIKMINGIPIDYDFGHGSIVFLINNNSILITAETPESIIKPKIIDDDKQDSSESSTHLFREVDDSNSEDYSDGTVFSSIDIDDGSEMNRSNSMTFNSNSSNMASLLPKKIPKERSLCSLPFAKSDSDIFKNNAGFQFNDNESLRGNSNSFVLSFHIKSDDEKNMIEHVEWVSEHKIVLLSNNSIYLIDLHKREITEPLINRFDKNCVIITNVFFSKSRKIMCVIMNHKQAYIINSESNLDVIKSIDFGKREYSLIGCISPKEDQIVFASENFLFFVDLNDKDFSLKKICSSMEYKASCILWKTRGIFVGTEKGSVFLITKAKLSDILKKSEMRNKDAKVIYDFARHTNMKIGPINKIISCANQSLIIIDSNSHGFIISEKIQKIADNIKLIKKCSKETFLIRLHNYNKLITINAFGDFSPPQPPCFYSTKRENISFNPDINKYIEALKESNQNDEIIGFYRQFFLTKETNHSISLKNSLHLLNQIISFYSSFNYLSSKASLALGSLEKARNILLSTDPNDSEYLNNMMLAALYNDNNNKSESVDLVVKNLLSNNLIDRAIDILLITRDSYLAAESLSKFGRNEDAYYILMLNETKFESDDAKKLAQKIANLLISKKENIVFGLKLLSSFGFIKEMINDISSNFC